MRRQYDVACRVRSFSQTTLSFNCKSKTFYDRWKKIFRSTCDKLLGLLEYARAEFVFNSVFIFLKNVSRKFLPPQKESQNLNIGSSPQAILVSFRNVWPLLSWFHWNKSGKLSMCRSFSCSNYTISFVKKQIVWKLISQKLIVKFK